MRVRTLELFNFRNYGQARIEPDEGVTVFAGPNAQGKTNILEALHLCCLGRSHRTPRDEELIRWGEPSARVTVQTAQRDGTHEVGVLLSRTGKKKKIVRIGARQAERIGELFGHVCGVLFSPEDLQIVKSGPAERRRFIDMQLSQLRPAYFYALQRAVRTLNQRNALLREIAKNPSLTPTLEMWDEQLAQCGAQIAENRREAVERLGRFAAQAHSDLTGGRETLALRYLSQAGEGDAREALLKRLHAARAEDLRRMSTSVGIHRDDILITIDGREARTFASQGQQRSAVLALKLAQLELCLAERGESPILMLDDVMSELDPQRRRQLIERIDRVQTFVTCTDVSDLAGARQGAVYHVENGRLSS
ncbi:MAG: DNA replication/repair protein RecF [Clostridiales bacterium]|nr:DNA replication/repair protein RecF [Clostridiales bacterium]